MSVGNRIFLQRNLPDPKIMEQFRNLPAANVADTMGRSCALCSEIHLINRPKDSIMVGAALTVKARPGDNLFIHRALDLAGENDVVVVSNEGDRSQSLMGEIMAVYAEHTRKFGVSSWMVQSVTWTNCPRWSICSSTLPAPPQAVPIRRGQERSMFQFP